MVRTQSGPLPCDQVAVARFWNRSPIVFLSTSGVCWIRVSHLTTQSASFFRTCPFPCFLCSQRLAPAPPAVTYGFPSRNQSLQVDVRWVISCIWAIFPSRANESNIPPFLHSWCCARAGVCVLGEGWGGLEDPIRHDLWIPFTRYKTLHKSWQS